MNYLDIIKHTLEKERARIVAVSDQIWEFAEVRYEEEQSAALMAQTLEDAGFAVTRNAGDISTAFVASFGEGQPVIAILGEYDALPSLSQEANRDCYAPVVKAGHGHGCGHNLLGSGALAAALAAKACIETLGLGGTIKYYGCPAEEGGGGKAYMARAGLFDGIDAAFTWHPWDENLAYNARMLATNQVKYSFKGKSTHAAFSPHLGRSALDGVELMNVGANFLREHIIPEARLHYAITNAGGRAPNVVQSDAEVLYKIRSPKMQQVREITERVHDIAQGAALMSGTAVSIEFDAASADLIPNVTLASMLDEELAKVGALTFTAEEKAFARAIQQTFSDEEKRLLAKRGDVLAEQLTPLRKEPDFLNGSTDVGDVSWLVPVGQVYIATCARGTPPHSWQMVTQGKTSYAHKGMLLAGSVMAAAVVRALTTPELIAAAQQEHTEQLDGESYRSLLPAEAKPRPLSD
ncbi:aminobenzoyl-glutamate utilization protein B [Erwinia toletana]|uniref:Aminobenzoyl-glutamate utilization protein B n=1 Tax=Winslowiella toletana TaxID=92490 RepID=A0ABS4PGM7_9GAMM|nr:amidohydrolase [Winslowiella toletana]MBP2171280.1 aminobenzoyl-glutamate utilization protein B [Winslowiella toletana]